MSAKPRQLDPTNVGTSGPTIPMGLRILAIILRALRVNHARKNLRLSPT
jgi:hypothetical protein